MMAREFLRSTPSKDNWRFVDVDNDRDLDLLHSGRFYENLGGNSFARPMLLREFRNTIQVGEFDGDEFPEIVTAENGRVNVWEFAVGAGLVKRADLLSRVSVGGDDAEQLRVADLDGDLDLDVLHGAGGNVGWYENTDGKGLFGERSVIAKQGTYELQATWDLEAVDIDSDGDRDVLTSSSQGRYVYAWYENLDGRGRFAPQQLLADERTSAIGVRLLPREIETGDFDRDGDVDLLLSHTDNGYVTEWFKNEGRTGVLPGDFNRDQVVDVKDVDTWCAATPPNETPREPKDYNLNSDFWINSRDLDFLLVNILRLPLGDVDGDGVFDSSDLDQIFRNGEYEDAIEGNSLWSEGDWNCDGEFTSSDLIEVLRRPG
jgi:hypothetical protein